MKKPNVSLDYIDGLVIAISLACGIEIVFAMLNLWVWFGMGVWLIITLALSLGFGHASRAGFLRNALLVVFLGFCGLLGMIVLGHDPASETLILGFPVGTAVLVYGIWPFGMIGAVLYALVYDRWVTPADKLDHFLRQFCRSKEQP
jgi:hypothetical protein